MESLVLFTACCSVRNGQLRSSAYQLLAGCGKHPRLGACEGWASVREGEEAEESGIKLGSIRMQIA